MELLIATHNSGKVEEYRALLSAYRVIGLEDVGLGAVDVEETGDTFAKNAVLKAVTYARASGKIALADDSGLCVDALNGAPGVYSARYGGEGKTDADRRQYLLAQLQTVASPRTAYFVCVIAIHHPKTGQTLVAEGRCEGEILTEERGENGFGYDRLFLPNGYTQTFGELPADLKNVISHRAHAVAQVPELLKAWHA